ncbi:MAG: hydantoinase/oxoprolinase family protein [Gammaproteobacteria bacterium]|nr:hydantoinase/oxoprolinase family protein [Gammaproteobacteria bacterium]
MLWVGVDVGGTFTDAVAYDDAKGQVTYAKAPSTPADPTAAVIDAIQGLGVAPGDIDRFVHGITIGTNAILQGRGAKVWMLVTRGFRDVLEIARTNRTQLYDIKALKQPPIVDRLRVLEIDERLHYDGSVRLPLDEAQVRQSVEAMDAQPGDAVAVCFIHSYVHPAHERRAADIVREMRPELFVCASSEVLQQMREYDRFSTAALNAYIGPLMARYLGSLQSRLQQQGFGREIYIMTSNGGVSTASRATRLPVGTVLSGPAGGVAATLHLGWLTGHENLITCDMGGTSTDVCLIENLQVPVTEQQTIAGHSNRTPQIEINAVGAGGGSIAWLDRGDILMVGPQSAGADPGPACYGQGGLEPTVTDANLVLQRLDPGTRLAGRITLDRERSLAALKPIQEKLGLDALQLADGIVQIAVARMVSAIKQISIAKGYDPRDFVLCPYGGAGPMHAAFIADELEITRALVPMGPGNFAAFGSLISDIRQDYSRTHAMQTRNADFADIENVFAEIEQEGRANLIAEGVDADQIFTTRAVGMRYLGQSWQLEVDVPSTITTRDALEAAFHDVHERRFGHRSDAATEVVTFRVAAIGRVSKPALPAWPVSGELADARIASRAVYFGGWHQDVPVYDRVRLPRDREVVGPAVIEESGSTTILPPLWRCHVLSSGDIFMERR